MYSITSKAIATGVIVASLLIAVPVFAGSNNSDSGNGLHLGVFAKLLHEDRQDLREDRREDRKEAQEERKEARRHATSTSATTTKQFTIEGSITFVSGSTLTVQGSRGAVYTVNVANASIIGHENVALTLAALAVNDKVKVTGTLSNSVIVATKIKDKSDTTGKMFRAVSAGIVTAINGTSVIFERFGASGTSSVTVSDATKYKVNGQATSSTALKVGSHVIVAGSSTAATGGTINASIVYIITEGFGWLTHFWR